MPRVIAETGELLVLDKPAGLIVHSDGRTQESSVAEWVAKQYPALLSVGGSWTSPQGEIVPLPGIVHRLDRTTSGVMVLAKTNEVYVHLKAEFKARRVHKTYRAFVYGQMHGSGVIVAEIMRSRGSVKRWYARACEESDPRAAVTEWKSVKEVQDRTNGEAASYIELYPMTGRTHQIRVHLSSIGYPILADDRYSDNRPHILGFTRPALHAHSISLVLNDTMHAFQAPFPEDFLAAGAT